MVYTGQIITNLNNKCGGYRETQVISTEAGLEKTQNWEATKHVSVHSASF